MEEILYFESITEFIDSEVDMVKIKIRKGGEWTKVGKKTFKFRF